jgi:hypothetical protein
VQDDQHPWGGYYELRKLSLHEVGPCLVGANQETELLAAKSHALARGAKAGRVLSQANYDSLTKAYEAIGEVLAAATPEKSRTEKTTEEPGQPGEPAADGTPSAKPDTPPAEGATESIDTPSTTEDETTPDPREAATAAAKAGTDSARLRTRLELAELEASLTE